MSLIQKNIIHRLGCIVFFLLFYLSALADEYPMLHYTKDNGLPSNTIYNLYRDNRGFIWIATDKGVVRYNGLSFETFNTSDGLPDNEIFSFQEDYRHRVWMAAYSGALCYYENGVFHNPENTPFLRLPIKLEHPIRINLEKDSTITVCYKNLPYFINIKDDSCRIYQNGKAKNEISWILNICKISDNIYCVSNENKTYILNVITGAVIYGTFHQKLHCSIFQNQKHFFDFAFIYNENYKKIYPIPASLQKSQIDINQLFFDGKNHLMATDDGVYINGELMLLKGKRVTSVTEDIAGDYWMSTIGEGIYRIHKNFRKNRVSRNAYKGVVSYACNYAGIQYFATSNRHLYEVRNGIVKMLLDYSKGVGKVRNQGNHIDCSINNHTLYCVGGNGNIFTYDILNEKIKKFVVPKSYTEFIAMGRWKSIIATKMGLNIISTAFIDFIPYISFDGNQYIKQIKHLSFNNRFYATTSYNKAGIIHSGLNGIYITAGGHPTLQPQYGNRLFVWLKYWNNKLVGCTPTNDLYVFSTTGINVKTDSFLSKKTIWNNAYPLSSDMLLLTSNKHYYTLSLADVHTNKILPKPLENPYVPSDTEYFLSDSDNCYFFKSGDITIIKREDLFKDVPAPAMYFAKVTVEDSIFRLGNTDSELILSGKHTNARISFDVLAFNAIDIAYEYCIARDGNKPSDWEQVNNKELNLILPRYGNIKVLARARTQGGISSEIKQFNIIILKPWWARWWGITGIVFASIAVTGFIFYFFIQRALKRKEREHNAEIKVLNAEFKSLNAMMNPHFIFNTLNNIQGFINADNKLQANEYIRTFSDMVRQNMLNISKELVTLEEEMMTVESYLKLQHLRFKNISYDIDIDPATDLDEIMIPPLLIQPLVENSIKHGIFPLNNKEGHIGIKITGADETVRIEIIDNGIGISKSQGRKSSFALGALRQRINTLSITHHIDISFEIGDYTNASQASGTRVLLTISYR